MERTVEIAAYNTQLEADLVVAKLAEAGIEAVVLVDNLGGTFPMMQMITGGYKVHVLPMFEEEAREIVGADEGTPVEARSERSAIVRFLSRLTPAQILGVLVLLGASFAATIVAVTRGTL